MDRLERACELFGDRCGVAYLKGHATTSIMRWLVSGSLTEAQTKELNDIYEQLGEEA